MSVHEILPINVQKVKKQKNNTKDSNVVPHRSTNLARQCLTSLSRREAVLSLWYGRSCTRRRKKNLYSNFSILPLWDTNHCLPLLSMFDISIIHQSLALNVLSSLLLRYEISLGRSWVEMGLPKRDLRRQDLFISAYHLGILPSSCLRCSSSSAYTGWILPLY